MNVLESISTTVKSDPSTPDGRGPERSDGFERLLQRAIREPRESEPRRGASDPGEGRQDADSPPHPESTTSADQRRSDPDMESSLNRENSERADRQGVDPAPLQEQITITVAEQYETTLPVETITLTEMGATGTGPISVQPVAVELSTDTNPEVSDEMATGEILEITSEDAALANPAEREGVFSSREGGVSTLNTGSALRTESRTETLPGVDPQISNPLNQSASTEEPGIATIPDQSISTMQSGENTELVSPPDQAASLESTRGQADTSQVPIMDQELVVGVTTATDASPRSTLTPERKFQIDGRPVVEESLEVERRSLTADLSHKPTRATLVNPGAAPAQPAWSGRESVAGGPEMGQETLAADPGGKGAIEEMPAESGFNLRTPAPGTGPAQIPLTGSSAVSVGQAGDSLPPSEIGGSAPSQEITLDNIPRETIKIVESMTREGQRAFETTIRLDPPELGQLRVEVKLESDRLSARFIVDNAAARQQLEQEIPRLRAVLDSQGLEEAQVEVHIEQGSSENWREQGEEPAGGDSGWGENSADQNWGELNGQGEISSHDGLINLRA